MEIATILNVHNNPELTRDTIDSVRAWCTRKIVLVIDKAGWENYEGFTHPDTVVVCGVYHGVSRSPYKNIAIGLMKAYELWPRVSWYNYIEYDFLYLNDHFKNSLKAGRNYSLIGINYETHHHVNNHWMTKDAFRGTGYSGPELVCRKMLGALMYFSNKCMKGLADIDYFNYILEHTKTFKGDAFPHFTDYAVEEILYTTAATAFGELIDIRELDPTQHFAVRWGDAIEPNEIKPHTTAVHPSKSLDCPIRQHYARSRKFFLPGV